ncbi:MAG TPA: LLM class flavin-dependent oxidoreductase [candidate division Zixibacteria bacterium]|nr:LLM class flavin-dependent oxidoreductase [candidate division Zixibacteria bacterium]
MRIGFKLSQTIADLSLLLETWDAGEELEVFDSGWIFDHFVALGGEPGPSHEALTLAGALAVRSRRLQLGHLVLGNTYRHPAVVANAAATLDHLAPGRFVLGLGAGWHEGEHAMYGIPLPPIGERISMLESAVRVIKALFAHPGGVSLDAPPYRLTDAVLDPPPATPGGPPLWLGTQGLRRGLRIVARHADGWNSTGDPAALVEKRDALLRHCEAVGRDPSEIEISAQTNVRDGHAAALERAAALVEAGVRHMVLIMPVQQGPDGLQRLAREVAEPLRERFG